MNRLNFKRNGEAELGGGVLLFAVHALSDDRKWSAGINTAFGSFEMYSGSSSSPENATRDAERRGQEICDAIARKVNCSPQSIAYGRKRIKLRWRNDGTALIGGWIGFFVRRVSNGTGFLPYIVREGDHLLGCAAINNQPSSLRNSRRRCQDTYNAIWQKLFGG